MGVLGDANRLRWAGGPPGFGTYGGLAGGNTYSGSNPWLQGARIGGNSTFQPGVPPPASSGSGSSSGSYSSLPGISPIRDALEGSILDQIKNPGLSKGVMDSMYLRSSEPLAAREASDKQQLSDEAAARGFQSSGDVMAGLAGVSSDYSGQRNALRRDIEIHGETDRLNRKENAARIGSDYLNTLRTHNRADAAFDQRSSTGLPGLSGGYRGYDDGGAKAPPGLTNVFGNWGNRVGGGATQSDRYGRPGTWNTSPTTSVSMQAPNYNTGNTVSGFGGGSNSKKPNFMDIWS